MSTVQSIPAPPPVDEQTLQEVPMQEDLPATPCPSLAEEKLQDENTDLLQEQLRHHRVYMLEVLESLPRGIVNLSSTDVAWLIEAVRTLGLSKLQATSLANRLFRD